MTGRYPFRTDITRWPKQPLIEKGQVTIASLLRDAGLSHRDGGQVASRLSRRTVTTSRCAGGPVDCGFDSFFGLRASTDIPPYFYIRGDRAVTPPTGHIAEHHSEGWSPTQGAFWREGGIAPGLELKDVLPKLTDEACAVINAQAGKKPDARQPLMLYLAYTAPHTPWLPAAEFAGKSGAGMYGDFVMMVDAQIGRVLAALEKADMTQDTLLIFTSDNGPVWYPADVARFGHDAVGGLRGMKADAWEGGHRMPFIVRWPGRVKAGTVSDQTICFTDLLATFADICGAKLPAGAGPDSFSFLPVLEGRQPEGPTDSRPDRDAGGQFVGHDDPVRRLETHQSARLRRLLQTQDDQTRAPASPQASSTTSAPIRPRRRTLPPSTRTRSKSSCPPCRRTWTAGAADESQVGPPIHPENTQTLLLLCCAPRASWPLARAAPRQDWRRALNRSSRVFSCPGRRIRLIGIGFIDAPQFNNQGRRGNLPSRWQGYSGLFDHSLPS